MNMFDYLVMGVDLNSVTKGQILAMGASGAITRDESARLVVMLETAKKSRNGERLESDRRDLLGLLQRAGIRGVATATPNGVQIGSTEITAKQLSKVARVLRAVFDAQCNEADEVSPPSLSAVG
ncbi:MAG: hypothetical protein Q8O87_04230 [bacterium]|nr:hypothetical protein [bacterium]